MTTTRKPSQRRPAAAHGQPAEALRAGQEAYGRHAWADAYEAFVRADEISPLAAADLTQLAMAAWLIGRDDAATVAMDRLYRAHLEADDDLPAARTAFWIGFQLLTLGDIGQATGWLGRAERLAGPHDCAEKGYLLLPVARRHISMRDLDTGAALASEAIAIAERFDDADLAALARMLKGRALVRQGKLPDGLALLDEAMIAAMSDDLMPIVTGVVYCSVIADCQEVYALDRAREWTSVLARWCAAQPQLVAFSGTCLVHRAEVMQLSGAWSEAIAEVERAHRRLSRAADPEATAAAFYQQAEVHRLRGEFGEADEAYRAASQAGGDPQPGLALLRLAEGGTDAAAGAIRRAVDGTTDPLRRARLLPAYVDIMLACGDRDTARAAATELGEIAGRFDAEILAAIAAHADGAVRLAGGDQQGALVPLRHAFTVWQHVNAPYLAARIRVLIGIACRALGDDDGASLEFDAARGVFEGLGALPDLKRLADLAGGGRRPPSHGLTERELQVLALVAAGKTNKMIARQLTLSEKTVDRHVSNIFVKLDVPSRAAATAFAYKHNLV